MKDLNKLSVEELKALWEQGVVDLEDIPEYRDWVEMNRQCDPDWVNPYPERKQQRRQ